MTLKEHLTYGGIVTAAIYPHFGPKSFFFYGASVLIDSDHYIDFLYFSRFRDWSIKRMFQFHGKLLEWRSRPNMMALEDFHCAEFHLAILGLALYYGSSELLFVFAGLMFHMACDLIRLHQWRRIDLRALTFVEYLARKKKMAARGLHPESAFDQAYALVSSPQPAPVSSPLLQREPA